MWKKEICLIQSIWISEIIQRSPSTKIPKVSKWTWDKSCYMNKQLIKLLEERVRVNGQFSQWREVTSGVLQRHDGTQAV